MFARKVAARVKSDRLPEFINIVEKGILPWLRKQEGFVDLIVLALRGSDEVATVSFWNHEADADAWATSGFQEATKALDKILEGPSYVKTFDVISSTVHGDDTLRRFDQDVLREDSIDSFPPTREIPQ